MTAVIPSVMLRYLFRIDIISLQKCTFFTRNLLWIVHSSLDGIMRFSFRVKSMASENA